MIANNTAQYFGSFAGGVWADDGATIENNVILNNDCWDGGGGIVGGEGAIIRNNTVAGNTSSWGGGGVHASAADVLSNIVVSNSSWEGGGIFATGGALVLNNIVAYTEDGGADGAAIWIRDYLGTPVVDYNCLFDNVEGDWGGTGMPGPNNIFEDPLLDADMVHLLPGSPCIDAGDPDYIPEPGQTDPDGQPRVVYERVDIGADEFLNPGDYDNDGDVDAAGRVDGLHDRSAERTLRWWVRALRRRPRPRRRPARLPQFPDGVHRITVISEPRTSVRADVRPRGRPGRARARAATAHSRGRLCHTARGSRPRLAG